MRWLLAVGVVDAVIIVWALFVSEKAAVDLSRPVRFVIELAVVGAATAALAATGHPVIAIAFAVVAFVSGALNYVWD